MVAKKETAVMEEEFSFAVTDVDGNRVEAGQKARVTAAQAEKYFRKEEVRRAATGVSPAASARRAATGVSPAAPALPPIAEVTFGELVDEEGDAD